MKLKRFENVKSVDDFEDDYYNQKDEFSDIIDELNPTNQDVIDELLSTIRKMLKNSGFENFYVFDKDSYTICIQFVLNKIERYAKIMKIMNFLAKLKDDILIQYETEFDVWETKEGSPLITASFSIDDI